MAGSSCWERVFVIDSVVKIDQKYILWYHTIQYNTNITMSYLFLDGITLPFVHIHFTV